MFFFKDSVMANYEKNFYDFKIEAINGEIINLNECKIALIKFLPS